MAKLELEFNPRRIECLGDTGGTGDRGEGQVMVSQIPETRMIPGVQER